MTPPSLNRRSSESTPRSATAAALDRVKSAGSERGFPHGHLNHLKPAQEEALKNFKLFLIEKGLYRTGPPPSHDDQTLLRFLRARRWVVEDAYKQFKDTEDWRAGNHLDVLYSTIDLEAYEQCRILYPQWTGRRDKRGIPLYVFEIRHLDSKTISKYEKLSNTTYSRAKSDGKTPPKLLRLFALYENLTRFVQPLCTEMPDREHAQTPITMSTNIVDVTGVSLRQFWNLKAHMQSASTLATAHYPETLDRIFVIGAPFFFSTVWGWIKRWFDPVTVSKMFILSQDEVLPTLQKFIDVKNIPKSYGGELAWDWGQVPNLDPAIKTAVSWEAGVDEFPPGPLYWQPIDGNQIECLAVGTEKQIDRSQKICTMPRSFQGNLASVPGSGAPATSTTNGAPPEVAQKVVSGEPTTTILEGKVLESPAPAPETHAKSGDLVDATTQTPSNKATVAEEVTPAEGVVAETQPIPQSTQEVTIDGTQGIQNLSIIDK